MLNQFCHIEIYSKDVEQSQAFYSKLFGWKTTPMMPEYMLFDAAGGTGGAFSTYLKPEQRHCLYIAVEDIEAKLAEVETAGGTISMPKTKISDEHGYMALFTDPHGTAMGLWSQH
jgi:uncharacterized protein